MMIILTIFYLFILGGKRKYNDNDEDDSRKRQKEHVSFRQILCDYQPY
jgi:hypothetical protein